VSDPFTLFGHPRRPWIDPDTLKGTFLRLSAATHPDRFHEAPPTELEEATRRYTALNAAYQCLREPRDRLLQLIELETGSKPKAVQRIPPGTMELFAAIGLACRETDEFVAKRSTVTSPLVKVQMFEESHARSDHLLEMQRTVAAKEADLLMELRAMNPVWEACDSLAPEARLQSLPLERLEQLYRLFSYAARWNEQLRERIAQLATA